MTTFRPDTSFPFLAVSRRESVSYELVLGFVEFLDAVPSGATVDLGRVPPWAPAVLKVWGAERQRRRDVR